MTSPDTPLAPPLRLPGFHSVLRWKKQLVFFIVKQFKKKIPDLLDTIISKKIFDEVDVNQSANKFLDVNTKHIRFIKSNFPFV